MKYLLLVCSACADTCTVCSSACCDSTRHSSTRSSQPIHGLVYNSYACTGYTDTDLHNDTILGYTLFTQARCVRAVEAAVNHAHVSSDAAEKAAVIDVIHKLCRSSDDV